MHAAIDLEFYVSMPRLMSENAKSEVLISSSTPLTSSGISSVADSSVSSISFTPLEALSSSSDRLGAFLMPNILWACGVFFMRMVWDTGLFLCFMILASASKLRDERMASLALRKKNLNPAYYATSDSESCLHYLIAI